MKILLIDEAKIFFVDSFYAAKFFCADFQIPIRNFYRASKIFSH